MFDGQGRNKTVIIVLRLGTGGTRFLGLVRNLARTWRQGSGRRKMSATFVLLQLAGFVALLLWGMRMVHTGMVRAFGGNLRQFLATGLKSRWKAFLAGMGITALLQSSTATALMSTSFIAAGCRARIGRAAAMVRGGRSP